MLVTLQHITRETKSVAFHSGKPKRQTELAAALENADAQELQKHRLQAGNVC